MTSLGPLFRDQRKIDASHLKLIAIFHFVFGGILIACLALIGLHWFLMRAIFSDPTVWKNSSNPPPPPELFAVFGWFYLVFASLLILGTIANALSGWLILKRRARLYSLIVAGVNCLAFPFGSLLGGFTFAVLLRETVGELYVAESEVR